MRSRDLDRIKFIADFPSLVEYLKEDLGWELEAEDVEDLVFEYEPEELGLDEAHKVKIRGIKQLRPLAPNQPWGIFYLDFEPKRLPVVVLRRILRSLVPKKRASAANPHQAVWNMNDLLFISALGERGNRGISFAHFKENGGGPPQLQTFSWDERETHLYYLNLNLERLRWPEDTDDVEAWREQWSSAFTTTHRQVIKTSKELSVELAKFARHTRELVREVYGYEAEGGSLHRLHESFRTVLIQDLDVDGFADMVAQTIAYGLFSARVTGEEVLGLAHLEDMVPNTNPFLKELFGEFTKLSGHEKHQIDFDELGVSELVDLLNTTDIEAILRDFGRQTGGGAEDPVIHFYESFLSEYDKQQKVSRGVFYTPKPVVSYIVRSVDKLLREELDCPDGLADTSTMEWNGEVWPKVMILDPATGTGTFLEMVIEVIHDTMTKKWEAEGKNSAQIHAAWNEYVPKHLLPRLHGFELMMAPYSVAHMKLGLKLKQTGYEFESNERLRVYLTNTLEEPQDFSGRLYADFLAHEAEAANQVKSKAPVTVIIGNPPYSLVSANLGQEQRALVEHYKYIDGNRLSERGALQLEKILNDDYVKFIAYAESRALQVPQATVSLITNHAYLDNPTMRGMRASLTSSFNYGFLWDLRGSAKKSVGETDENVFDIQQGVAISLWVRTRNSNEWRFFHRLSTGSRLEKYVALSENIYGTVEWTPLSVTEPEFLLIPTNYDLKEEFNSMPSITEVFQARSIGFFTSKDRLVIGRKASEVENKVREFRDSTLSDQELCDAVGIKAKKAWNVSRSRHQLREIRNLASHIQPFLHRPFDSKYVFYDRSLVWSMAWPINRNMVQGHNIALTTSRQLAAPPWQHVFCSDTLVELTYITNKTKEGNHVFPLYIYPDPGRESLDFDGVERKPNLAAEFVGELSKSLHLQFVVDGHGDLEKTLGPEDVFHYAYAVFHSPTYRERYAEFLKRDFPQLPLTTDLDLFSELVQWGAELVSLHLMRAPYLDNPFTTFPQSGSNVMEKAKYDPEEKRVYINKEKQYFDKVPEETWHFRVGGYQVLDKWLKDRKGRVLSTEDIEHYRKVVAALHETQQIMQEIDEVIEAHGGWPLAGSVPTEAQ